MDIDRASKETVDPTYLWIGPNESTLTGSSQINITNAGELVLKDFMESLSGYYSCTLSYKIVKAETQEETSLKKKYDFLVFGASRGQQRATDTWRWSTHEPSMEDAEPQLLTTVPSLQPQ